MVIHVVQLGSGECASHSIPVKDVVHVKCRYVSKGIGTAIGFTDGKSKDKCNNTVDFILRSGAKVSLVLDKKTVFRILDDNKIVFEDASLQKFEKALLPELSEAGVYQPF